MKYKWTVCLASCFFYLSCGNRDSPGGNGPKLTPIQEAANLLPRIGIAVRTDSRTCMAIQNGNLAPASPLTLVIAKSPQSFVPARIKAIAKDVCPITKEQDPAFSSYDLSLPNGSESVPKLSPLIAVVGDTTGFVINNINVEADLEGNRHRNQFHACNTPDGIHLTIWSGTPLSSSLLWHGFYYQAENAAPGPSCTPQETRNP